MQDLFEWQKVADDLSEKHDLNGDQIKRLEQQLIYALFSGKIPPRDKYGKVISPFVKMVKGGRDVCIQVSDVNKFFFEVEPKYVWKPRKKKGRPMGTSILKANSISGKLKSDAKEAASQLKRISGRTPQRRQVADRLASCFPDYTDYTANFIEKFIRVSWWRGD
jgi:hypothetical protein